MFKIFIIIAATFVLPGSDKIVERQIVNDAGSFASLLECRDALQHSAHVQGAMASAVKKLNDFADAFNEPPGYSLRGKRLRAGCLPAIVTPAEIKAHLAD